MLLTQDTILGRDDRSARAAGGRVQRNDKAREMHTRTCAPAATAMHGVGLRAIPTLLVSVRRVIYTS
jgi:hypothetical protein